MQTRMVGVARMSLPDATRSDRVYPLLQNLDLENLAFATVQGVGNTLNIEEMNEDELRRLVLVNLARLTVSGEWNGLLSAGGGSPGQTLVGSTEVNGTGTSYNTVYNSMGTVHQATQNTTVLNNAYFVPFVAPRSATVDSLTVNCSTSDAGSSMDVGFYNMTEDGGVGSQISYATIDTTATGLRTQTSLSATLTFEKGTTYWMGWVKSAGSGTMATWSTSDGMAPLGVQRNDVNSGEAVLYYNPTVGSATALPTGTFSASDWRSSAYNVPCVGILWS